MELGDNRSPTLIAKTQTLQTKRFSTRYTNKPTNNPGDPSGPDPLLNERCRHDNRQRQYRESSD